ncbi:uncharacterized protein LOC109850141 [Asparagus officinalis]|uniref:uncharacterized protein LOC109850141 n=1 Tax=Asparagus officinalis TaxID=4686 RepID=UPI00098E68E3|nr:uncharacterized protein LOC109850141 [Asparagus officinalis]XP_020275663.1 uncharacterized protein LOC109850141 [Asparagus officinalis]
MASCGYHSPQFSEKLVSLPKHTTDGQAKHFFTRDDGKYSGFHLYLSGDENSLAGNMMGNIAGKIQSSVCPLCGLIFLIYVQFCCTHWGNTLLLVILEILAISRISEIRLIKGWKNLEDQSSQMIGVLLPTQAWISLQKDGLPIAYPILTRIVVLVKCLRL